MVKLLTNCIIPFLSRPTENIHQAELSKLTKTQHTTLRLWLNQLVSEGILQKDSKGRLTLYSLNFQNPSTFQYILLAEKSNLINKCENSLLLKELTNYLVQNIDGDMLIFGSAVESIKDANDIDLIIIGKYNPEKIEIISSKINKEIHIINIMTITEISETLKKEIIKKHLLIKNSEKLLRWMLW